ncbi:hypothetical protein IM543_14075 [Massilia sp. UMI-21]|nr:hypothetical protein IM543_14075 [Massilia sp. UMI-21]
MTKDYPAAATDLFSRWRASSTDFQDHFVEDGIIDPAKWIHAGTRILFILRETNGYAGSMAALIHKACTTHPSSKLWDRPTFHNVGRWAHGLLHATAVTLPSFDVAHKNRKTALLPCAFINLKKTAGGARATKAVEHAAVRDAIFLREQIELIHPQVVVCGGTYRAIKQHLYPAIRRVAPRVHEAGGRLFINADHPSYLKKTTEMYDDVVGSYQRYLAALKEPTV